MATRIRMGQEFEQRVREVKTWFKEHDRQSFIWMIGPSATPRGLASVWWHKAHPRSPGLRPRPA